MPKRRKIEVTPEEAPASAGEQTAEEHAADATVESAEEQVRCQLAEAEARMQELNDRYLRTLADFENFRRRARHDRASAVRDGESAILLEVLPVLDNFARAMAAARESNDVQALMEGVKMAYDHLHAALARKGVRPIAAEGKQFDPLYHDAVGNVETTDQPEGTVAVEIQKGYMLGDRVLRPSRVLVAAKPAAAEGEPADDSEVA